MKIKALCAIALWLTCFCCLSVAKKPNVIFILTDDQGYGDVNAHGHPYLKTPHTNRLRAETWVIPTKAEKRLSATRTGRGRNRTRKNNPT